MSSPRPRWWVPSTTITREGRLTRLNLQTLVVVLIAVGVVGWAIAQFGRAQTGSGPNGSSFVTDVNGTAALAELLSQSGHIVSPQITAFTALDEARTILILDPGFRTEYGEDEIRSISGWVEGGGRLIVSGRPHPDLIGTLLPADLRLGFAGEDPAPIVTPIRGVRGSIETGGVFSIDTRADVVPLAGEPPIAAAFELGEGVVVYVADGSVFWNPTLVENGPWIVSLIPDGPVFFDEVRHGFTLDPAAESPTGLLAALPPSVRNVVLLLLPVLLIGLVVYGRRFGPAEETERRLAPPRRELVDAVAGLMSRMPDRAAAAELVPVRLREVVASKAGLPADAPEEALIDASARLGLDPERLRSALNAENEDTMLEAQRVLARLTGKENG